MFRRSSRCASGACVEVDLEFRTASKCEASNCVEVATTADFVAVRDSKPDNDGTMLMFTPAAWTSAMRALSQGDH
jgi:hypothetical protein